MFAARLMDMQLCPLITPPAIPHVGGVIMGPGAPTVLIGCMPAARVGDLTMCVGPPGAIVMGSMSVLIGAVPAARMGDMTAHGGAIMIGAPNVMIGLAPVVAALSAAAETGAPFVDNG